MITSIIGSRLVSKSRVIQTASFAFILLFFYICYQSMSKENMGLNYSLRNNLFVLDYEPERRIVYAPLQGQAFFCGVNEADEIESYIKTGCIPSSEILCNYLDSLGHAPVSVPKDTPAIDTDDRLVIILSQMCNMACTYCFAQESRSSLSMDETILKNAIDYVFAKGTSAKVFTFIGGGEPLIRWALLKSGITHIAKLSEEKGIEYSVRIITNGTLIDNERAAFLSKFHVSVSLSFEILPDIQNTQRPLHLETQSSYDAICRGIDCLRRHIIPFGFRSTITEINVNRMPEMVEYSLKHFPEVSKLHLEPATIEGLGTSFYRNYVKAFMDAFTIGDHSNLFVTNSFINSYFKIKRRFCQGELCLTPTGDFVACHRHSSSDDALFDIFRMGSADSKSISLIPHRVDSITAIWNEKDNECETCMAKWHCAGKCRSIRKSLTTDENPVHCSFIRELLTQFIGYNLKH